MMFDIGYAFSNKSMFVSKNKYNIYIKKINKFVISDFKNIHSKDAKNNFFRNFIATESYKI